MKLSKVTYVVFFPFWWLVSNFSLSFLTVIAEISWVIASTMGRSTWYKAQTLCHFETHSIAVRLQLYGEGCTYCHVKHTTNMKLRMGMHSMPLQKQFDHRVVSLVADKLEQQWLLEVHFWFWRQVGTKPGLWTLDWTMDCIIWTRFWTGTRVLELFRASHRPIIDCF